ncbi:hypothetical protein [Aquibacillus albus]|uniref:Uncharacterized protein n=1 Tax=Aquibacillus albus TaxID=1168171 RepID=A0ABS2N2D5_9BACI|nr:hypothetical protein [Aquibacillus albus]MBM7572308.1 hypothetical protein [Aquibacillus albus]
MSKMAKVEMIVQTMYNGQLLRAGKVYEVGDDTAQRWQISNIAKVVEDQQNRNSKN